MNSQAHQPPDATPTAQERTEEVLLGGRRRYTSTEVAELTGIPFERLQSRWRALGFAGADDQPVFTDADIEAARMSEGLIESGAIDESMDASVARALGHHLSRLAEWQVAAVRDWLARRPDLAGDPDQVEAAVSGILPTIERLQNYVWRRHLAAAAGRMFAAADDLESSSYQVVGFTDMVGYTRLTRRVDEETLRGVLETFEAVAGDMIAEHHGRVVKMIGDEVLFVADNPVDAVEIALALNERLEDDEDFPELRTGLAYGRVLSRFGDVYGSVVNIAARLVSTARPGTILLDTELADQLPEDSDYQLRSLRPVSVRGYSKLRRYVVRRGR